MPFIGLNAIFFFLDWCNRAVAVSDCFGGSATRKKKVFWITFYSLAMQFAIDLIHHYPVLRNMERGDRLPQGATGLLHAVCTCSRLSFCWSCSDCPPAGFKYRTCNARWEPQCEAAPPLASSHCSPRLPWFTLHGAEFVKPSTINEAQKLEYELRFEHE